MYFKLLFLAVSIITGVLGIVKLNNLPSQQYSLKQNYWRIAIFSSLGAILDFAMFWIIVGFIPPGDYGTGFELLAVFIVIILYSPPCIITSIRLKQRMKDYNKEYDVTKTNALNCSIVFKVMFILVEVIWIVEVM